MLRAWSAPSRWLALVPPVHNRAGRKAAIAVRAKWQTHHAHMQRFLQVIVLAFLAVTGALGAAGATSGTAASAGIAATAGPTAHTGTAWQAACTIYPPPPAQPGQFGAAVAMSEGRLWIGPARDADLGVGPPQVWALGLAAPCEPAAGGRAPAIVRIDHPRGDHSAAFGASIAALDACAVVGAPAAGCDSGACNRGEAWLVELVEQDRHKDAPHPLLTALEPPQLDAGDAFGTAVALCDRWIVVASPHATEGALHCGRVDVFRRSYAASGHAHARHHVRIVPPSPEASAWFGASVAISNDWLAVGEPGRDRTGDSDARACAHEHGREQEHEQIDAGAVHLYHRNGDSWILHSSLRAPASAVGWHGATVALAGEFLLVGAPIAARCPSTKGAASPSRGVVSLYRLQSHASAPTWRLERSFAPSSDGHGFGCSLATVPHDSSVAASMSHAAVAHVGNTLPLVVVGSIADSLVAPYGGAAWMLDLESGSVERLPCPDPREDEGLGRGVAASAEWVAVSVGGNPEQSPPAPGRVHLLRQVPPHDRDAITSRNRHQRQPSHRPRSPP
jgi:hypothetical protein